jgi:hypothetical protein
MAIELKKFDTRMGTHDGPEVRHLDPAAIPFYLPIGDEVEIFSAAYRARLPVLLKGLPDAARRASSSTWRITWRHSKTVPTN